MMLSPWPDAVHRHVLEALLALNTAAEQAIWRLAQVLNLAADVHGQPAWPLPVRLNTAMLTVDASLVRQVTVVAALVLLAALLLLLAALLAWPARRRQAAGLVAVAGALGMATAAVQWPDAVLLWVPALPTSQHRLPPDALATAPLAAPALYQQHCQSCHGSSGDGDGPQAAQAVRWPPTLNRSLLWRRSDGELFWHIRHGMQDGQGRATMPALASTVPDVGVWQLVAWLQWRAAGLQLARSGQWQLPLAAPALWVDCPGQPRRPLAALRGQRLRLVALGPDQPALPEDPRFQTITLRAQDAPAATRRPADDGCHAVDVAGWVAYALASGVSAAALDGTEFLIDRDGWLRARRRAADPPWGDAMLVCRADSPAAARPQPRAAAADPLDQLLARLDAEPVRPVRGGRLH